MAQDYDVSFKILLNLSRGLVAKQLFGPLGVTEWLNVELPKVNNTRADLVARCGDGMLRHVEIESRNHPETPRRKAEYYLALHRRMNEHVEQVLLFASSEPCRIPPIFKTLSMTYEFRILDLKTFDGEPLLASEDWGDNILALLTEVEQERVLCRVEEQLRKLDGEEKQNAASIFTIVSGIMGIEESVARRVNMIDIMENKVIGPAIRKGIAQGERDMLIRQLTKKFGPFSRKSLDRLQAASQSEILEWSDRILTAKKLSQIFT